MRTKFSISVFSAQKNASSVLDLIIPKIVEFAILDSSDSIMAVTRRALMDIGETGKITFANHAMRLAQNVMALFLPNVRDAQIYTGRMTLE